MKRIFGTGIFFSGLGFSHLGLLIYCGLRPPKVPLRSIPIRTSVYHCFTGKLFPVGCAQDSGNFAVFFALAPPKLETSGMFHKSYPHTSFYGFLLTACRSVVYKWRYGTFWPLQKAFNVWPGAAHAPIGVKLNPQVYSVQ